MVILLSASQIATFDLCARKWGWRYIAGIPDPTDDARQFGTDVHSLLEGWLRDGTAFTNQTKEGACATAALPHLPTPGTANVESEIFVQTDAALYTGRIDLHWMADSGIPHVWDHKTTGNFAYAETEEELPKNPQTLLYSAWAMEHYGTDSVHVTFGYLGKHRPKFLGVDVRMLRSDVEAGLDNIDASAVKMLAIHEKRIEGDETREKLVLSLDYNHRACEKFGGCPYRANCNLTTQEKIGGYMAQSALEKMRAKAAAAAKPSVASTMAKRGAAVNPPAEPEETPEEITTEPPRRPGRPAGSPNAPKESMADRASLAALQGLCGNPLIDFVNDESAVDVAVELAKAIGAKFGG